MELIMRLDGMDRLCTHGGGVGYIIVARLADVYDSGHVDSCCMLEEHIAFGKRLMYGQRL